MTAETLEKPASDDVVTAFAPAKINMTLHVTGRREDGYHILDSLVMFADVGDTISVRRADETTLTITGPMAAGVPTGQDNLAVRAAQMMNTTAQITLDKHLPLAGGIGGGSSDAAATLRALSQLTGAPMPEDVLALGADTPVCVIGTGAARMCDIGVDVRNAPGMPVLHAVLVNPMKPVMTADVFRRLKNVTTRQCRICRKARTPPR